MPPSRLSSPFPFRLARTAVVLAAAAAVLVSGVWVPPDGSTTADSSNPALSNPATSNPATSRRVTSNPATVPIAAKKAVNKKIAPSGKAMPKGNTKKWRKIFSDNFTGSTLKKPWTKYSGQPGGNPGGYWKPSHAVVSGGALHLKTYKDGGRWVSGGVGTWNGLAMKYGRIDVRFRAPKARGVSYAILLWPQNGGWPPEIDFAEDGGDDRRSTAATLHYGAANHQIQRHKAANFSKWHTVGVQWSPGKVVYTLDGKAWATVRSAGVPTKHMVLAIQSHAMSCGSKWFRCPDASTPKRSSIDIDWVVAYKRK